MSEMLSGSRAFICKAGSKVFAPSSNDARYRELTQTGGESFASTKVIRNDTTDVCPFPSSSVACVWWVKKCNQFYTNDIREQYT